MDDIYVGRFETHWKCSPISYHGTAWHSLSMGHRSGVMGERGEKYFPMGERFHSSNSQREIELQLSEKANLILPLIKT